ncbi:MAG: hypothetical protein AAFQ33_09840 [Pseudomonadota bacterium]
MTFNLAAILSGGTFSHTTASNSLWYPLINEAIKKLADCWRCLTLETLIKRATPFTNAASQFACFGAHLRQAHLSDTCQRHAPLGAIKPAIEDERLHAVRRDPQTKTDWVIVPFDPRSVASFRISNALLSKTHARPLAGDMAMRATVVSPYRQN